MDVVLPRTLAVGAFSEFVTLMTDAIDCASSVVPREKTTEATTTATLTTISRLSRLSSSSKTQQPRVDGPSDVEVGLMHARMAYVYSAGTSHHALELLPSFIYSLVTD